MTQNERRKNHRHTIGIHTEVYRKSYDALPLYTCEVRNIGLSGVNILNKDPTLRKGSRLKLLFVTSGVQDRVEMRVDARIEWDSGKEFGLSFCSMTEEDLAKFNKFIYIAKVALRSKERTRINH